MNLYDTVMPAELLLGDDIHQLRLSPEDGRITGYRYRGEELLPPAPGAFALRFLDQEGNYLPLGSADFRRFSFEDGFCRWWDCPEHPGLAVESRVRFEEGAFRFRPAVRGIPEGLWLELIDLPQVSIHYEDELFWPHEAGCLVREPWRSTRPFQQLAAGVCSDLTVYPGSCPTQYFSASNKGRGVYFAADDYTHATKVLEFNADGKERTRIRIECAVGEDGMKRECELPYDLLLKGFDGDWRDAALLYRDWVSHDPAMKRAISLPAWLEKSPVVVVYPVCGTGTISPEPNRFQPYDRALPRLLELAEGFGAPVMPHLMRWDQNGPWLPPYQWPPVGDFDSFLRFRDRLHETGNYLGLYGSGTFFTKRGKLTGYSAEEEYEKDGLERFMARGPKGETRAKGCRELRDSTELCVTEEWCREVLRDQVRQIAAHGVDFYQIFDQNHGAVCHSCYSKAHAHPPVPGVWQTKAMQRLINDLNSDIRALGSEMLLGAEGTAAGPYFAGLPFNDTRETTVYGITVPAAAMVFHALGGNNFCGNQAGAWKNIKCEERPDNLQFRLAESFLRGEYLTVTLRDSGEIDWGAAADWSRPAPRQEPVIALIRNLNRLRLEFPEFLLYGDLEKPWAKVESGRYVMPYIWGDEEYPALPAAGFRDRAGNRLQFIVNFREEPEVARVTPATPCRLRGEGELRSTPFTLTIPPLSAAVLFFS